MFIITMNETTSEQQRDDARIMLAPANAEEGGVYGVYCSQPPGADGDVMSLIFTIDIISTGSFFIQSLFHSLFPLPLSDQRHQLLLT